MATYYVRTDCGTSGDGTEDRTDGPTRAFVSLSAAIEARRTADSSPDDPLVFICSVGAGSAADTAAVTIGSWTLTATNTITIKPKAGEEAGTSWSPTKYRLEVSADEGIVLNSDYVRIERLQIKTTPSTTNYHSPITLTAATASANDYRISGCYLWANGSSTRSPALYINASDAVVKVWNCICYTTSSSTHAASCAITVNTSSAVSIYNCTLIGGTYGFNRITSGTITIKNTYASGVTEGYNGTFTSSYSASSAASDLSGTGDITTAVAKSTSAGAYFENVSAGTEDWAIKTDSALKNTGNDNGSETAPLNFTTDINGATRTTNYDIGADEYIATSSAGLPPHMLQSQTLGLSF